MIATAVHAAIKLKLYKQYHIRQKETGKKAGNLTYSELRLNKSFWQQASTLLSLSAAYLHYANGVSSCTSFKWVRGAHPELHHILACD